MEYRLGTQQNDPNSRVSNHRMRTRSFFRGCFLSGGENGRSSVTGARMGESRILGSLIR